MNATSPAQHVVDRGMGDHRGQCALCKAAGDDADENGAWLWVDDHRCGTESARVVRLG